MSQPNLMKKSSNSLKFVLKTECGECNMLKDTVAELQKTVRKLEEFLSNYKNDTDNKIGELHKELDKSKIGIENLHKEVVNLQSDNIDIFRNSV